MGGAGGHMWHPFDCPDVNSGQDLISFFQRSIESIKRNPAALKIDGVNLSFRLRENPNTPTGFEFVIDRGSMKPLDVEGVTADNADQRFVLPDGSPHGMVEATRILLGIFNAAIPEIMPELEQLGMTQDTGPFSLYFNTEFVLKKINVKEYPFNFIAIHGVNKFEQKGPKSRHGVGTEVDQALLDGIREKVQIFANERDFRVYTNIPTAFNNTVLLEDALNKEFTIVYKSFATDPEEPSELGAGEGSTKPLKVWLTNVGNNPVNQKVNISDKMRKIYPNMGKAQTPYAKNIYLEVLKGTAISDIALGPEDIESIVDAVVVMHATRLLGNAVLDALESDEFGSARKQEGVVVKDPEICGGSAFKFTGDFIVGGLLGSAFNEAKYRKGKLIKETTLYRENEEEEDTKQFIILVPGGFKPPTVGHYKMIKYYEKMPEIRKVFVVTGPKAREGVTLQQSKEIFDVYGGFSDKTDFITTSDPTPLTSCYELVKKEDFTNQFPNLNFSVGASDKEEDEKRIKDFVNYFIKNDSLTNVNVKYYPPAPAYEVDGEPASASRMRKAYRNEEWETFKKMLPDESVYNEVVTILNNQQGAVVSENFLLAVPPQSFLVEKMTKKEKNKKEKIVMGMKKDAASLEKKYGKDWEKVMYATATKQAIAEDISPETDEMIRNAVKEMLAGVITRIPEFNSPSISVAQKTAIGEPLVDAIAAQLSRAAGNVVGVEQEKELSSSQEEESQEIEDKLEEMSAMGAGAVGGHSGNPWLGEYDDE